jgi:hypothetical protein
MVSKQLVVQLTILKANGTVDSIYLTGVTKAMVGLTNVDK